MDGAPCVSSIDRRLNATATGLRKRRIAIPDMLDMTNILSSSSVLHHCSEKLAEMRGERRCYSVRHCIRCKFSDSDPVVRTDCWLAIS